MLVVGGINSLSGAVIGALVLSVMSQVLRDVESAVGRPGLTEVSFALITILILVLRPSRIRVASACSDGVSSRARTTLEATRTACHSLRHRCRRDRRSR